MTTAHRATWKPAHGGAGEDGSFSLNAPTSAVAIRDGAGQTALKTRDAPSRKRARTLLRDMRALPEVDAPDDGDAGLDADVVLGEDDDGDRGVKRAREGEGADRPVEDVEEDEESDESDSDDDDAELRAELGRIRAERAEEARRVVEEAATAAAAGDNPLMADRLDDGASEASGAPAFVKRRWDDDVVFKNQARRAPAPEVRFVNDTTRNDFHRRFMKRFVKN